MSNPGKRAIPPPRWPPKVVLPKRGRTIKPVAALFANPPPPLPNLGNPTDAPRKPPRNDGFSPPVLPKSICEWKLLSK